VLSRLAESFFWMGRYIERAEGTARLVLEMHQLLVGEGTDDQRRGASLVLHGLGFSDDPALGLIDLVSIVYGSPADPSSIYGSLEYARTNARSVRDALPADVFEVLNKAYLRASIRPNPFFPGSDLRDVVEGLTVVHGTFDWVSPRDEAYSFYELGGFLERIDQVARLLDMRIERGWPEQGPATVLRAVGGLNTFLRHHDRMNEDSLRHFLLVDPTFPRSILRSVVDAEASLRDIARFTSSRAEPVLRAIGVLRSRLEFGADLLSPGESDELVVQAREAVEFTSRAVQDNYFRPLGSIVWSH
jgi:uncharacterized alpha-E superfamily protein